MRYYFFTFLIYFYLLSCHSNKEAIQNPNTTNTVKLNLCEEQLDSFLNYYWIIPPYYANFDGYRLLSDSILTQIEQTKECLFGMSQNQLVDSFGLPAYVTDNNMVVYLLLNPNKHENRNLVFKFEDGKLKNLIVSDLHKID